MDKHKLLELFIHNNDSSPLTFRDYKYESTELCPGNPNPSIEDMIRRVLTLMEQYPSYNEIEYDCGSGHWRSSFDTWRHIIHFYPDVELVKVLAGLYDIKDECGGQFCNDIGRRTFRLKEANGITKEKGNWDNWDNDQEDIDNYNADDDSLDEYGLDWHDWRI